MYQVPKCRLHPATQTFEKRGSHTNRLKVAVWSAVHLAKSTLAVHSSRVHAGICGVCLLRRMVENVPETLDTPAATLTPPAGTLYSTLPCVDPVVTLYTVHW